MDKKSNILRNGIGTLTAAAALSFAVPAAANPEAYVPGVSEEAKRDLGTFSSGVVFGAALAVTIGLIAIGGRKREEGEPALPEKYKPCSSPAASEAPVKKECHLRLVK